MAFILQRQTHVEFFPENGPGKALIRVENGGRRQEFTASAKMLSVKEQVANPPFLQTLALRWEATGAPTITLDAGAAGALLVATSRKEKGVKYWDTPLFEVRLESFQEGGPAQADWRRWNGGDPEGAVTIRLEVTVSGRDARKPKKEYFVLKSKSWGGILIETDQSG